MNAYRIPELRLELVELLLALGNLENRLQNVFFLYLRTKLIRDDFDRENRIGVFETRNSSPMTFGVGEVGCVQFIAKKFSR